MSNIFYHIKEKSLAKYSGDKRRVVEYNDLNSVKNCLVCWSVSEKQNDWLGKIEDAFGKDNVTKICFVPEERVGEVQSADVLVPRKSDIGLGKKIKNAALASTLEKKYDLLLDLSTAPNVLLDYMIKRSAASCKTGMKREGFEPDIVVDGVNDPMEFIDRLVKILSEIKKY